MRNLVLGLCVVLAGCLAPFGETGDTLESIRADLDGFYFQTALHVEEAVAVGGPTRSGNFDPAQYPAFRFTGEAGRVLDVLSSRDWLFDWNMFSAGYVQQLWSVTNALFIWRPQNGSEDRNDPNNWSLLRLGYNEPDGSCWSCFAYDRTKMILPENNEYLLLVLTTSKNIEERAPFQVDIAYGEEREVTAGELTVVVKYSRFPGRPVEGLRVAVGTNEATTDSTGTAYFPSLLPNPYTIRLGSDGLFHAPTVVRPGRSSIRNITLSAPIR